MRKGLALLTLRDKMTDPVWGPPDEPDFLFSAVDFFNRTDLDTLTEENILDRYIAYLENLLGITQEK